MTAATGYAKLVSLLDELYRRKDELPNHTVRDQTGKVTNNNKHDAGNSWYMKRIKELFPDEPFRCYALGVCLRHLCTQYVTNIPNFKKVWPMLKRLSPWIAARQAQYFSDVKKALCEGKKSAAFKAQVAEIIRQTPEEKKQDNLLNPNNLDPRVEDPLLFDLMGFIQIIQQNQETTDKSVLGWILECVLGTRSIDLMNPEVMKIEPSRRSSSSVTITGHSKVRSDGQLEQVEAESRDVRPIGVNPDEAIRMVQRYRELGEEDLKRIQETNASQLKKLSKLKKIHLINVELTHLYNKGLGDAAKALFPPQAAYAAKRNQPFGSHIARALNANATADLYMPPGASIDVFLRDHLVHAGFGTSVSYKAVRFLKPGEIMPAKFLRVGEVSEADLPDAQFDEEPAEPDEADDGAFAAEADRPVRAAARADTLSLVVNRVAKLANKMNSLAEKIDGLDFKHNGGDDPVEEKQQPKKNTKRNVPKHRLPPRPARVRDANGKWVTLPVNTFERVVGLTDEMADDRVKTAEAILISFGIPTTGKNVGRMGVGKRSNCLRENAAPRDEECDPLDYTKEKERKRQRREAE